MPRILITGGCGFVGREVVARAVDRFDVHVLDNLRSGAHRLARMPLDRFTLHAADIRDAQAVERVMAAARPDVVLHLAAIHFIPECEAYPDRAVSTNVLGSVTLLSAAPKGCRFINLSSAAVYAPVSTPLDEATTALQPMDVYGWTKLQTEQYAEYFGRAKGFEAWSVRLFNVVGPGETNPHLVPEVAAQLRGGATQVRLGNLTPRRDFIDVGDAAEGLIRLATATPGALSAECAVVNLGTGRAHSVEEVLRCLAEIQGTATQIVSDPARVRAVDRPVLQASTVRLQRALGWVPATPLRETFARLMADDEPVVTPTS